MIGTLMFDFYNIFSAELFDLYSLKIFDIFSLMYRIIPPPELFLSSPNGGSGRFSGIATKTKITEIMKKKLNSQQIYNQIKSNINKLFCLRKTSHSKVARIDFPRISYFWICYMAKKKKKTKTRKRRKSTSSFLNQKSIQC